MIQILLENTRDFGGSPWPRAMEVSALRVGRLNPGCCGFWLNNPAHVVAMAPCSDKVTLSRIDSRSSERKTVARRLRRNPNLLHRTSPCSYPIMMSPITWEVSGQIHKKDSRASGGLTCPCPANHAHSPRFCPRKAGEMELER